MISLVSCKDDYQCECVYEWSDNTMTPYTYEIMNVSNDDAIDWCNTYNNYEGYKCELG